MCFIKKGDIEKLELQNQGLSFESIPQKGKIIQLRKTQMSQLAGFP